MDSPHDKYRAQIDDAWKELCAYEKAERLISERIADLRELIRATANFLPDGERMAEMILLETMKHPSNITEAVRSTLFIAMTKNLRLTPTDIKSRAEQRGFNFSEYTNPLASIHTILRRMRESDPPEVDYKEDDGTYLLINFKASEDMSEEFFNKMRLGVMSRIIDRAVDPELFKSLMIDISKEVTATELSKLKTKNRIRS